MGNPIAPHDKHLSDTNHAFTLRASVSGASAATSEKLKIPQLQSHSQRVETYLKSSHVSLLVSPTSKATHNQPAESILPKAYCVLHLRYVQHVTPELKHASRAAAA
jgi:hypothetical protein